MWSHQKPLVSREPRREVKEVERRKVEEEGEEPRRLSRPRRPERREEQVSSNQPPKG